MLLTLKVMSCRGLPSPEEISACFDQRNGTIGRADDNDLVLPDPENFISRLHANISYEDGRYSISDKSTEQNDSKFCPIHLSVSRFPANETTPVVSGN